MDMDMARGRLPPVIIIMVMDMVDMAMDTDMERGKLMLPLDTIIMVMAMDMDMDTDMERGRLMLPLATIIMVMDMVDMAMDTDMERGRLMLPLAIIIMVMDMLDMPWIWIWKEGSRPRLLSSWIWLWIPWLSSIYLLVSQNCIAFIGICWNLLSR